MPTALDERHPLTATERRALIVAAESAFLKLANLYAELLPIFARYGFKPQSAGVISRDVSEQIEEQIVLHCNTFTRGKGFADLARQGQQWEVKICKGNRLTINQSAQIHGENYIVVNYSKFSTLRRVWVLWQAEDEFFTPRKSNLNLRTILPAVAAPNVETIFEAPADSIRRPIAERIGTLPMAKAQLSAKSRRKTSA